MAASNDIEKRPKVNKELATLLGAPVLHRSPLQAVPQTRVVTPSIGKLWHRILFAPPGKSARLVQPLFQLVTWAPERTSMTAKLEESLRYTVHINMILCHCLALLTGKHAV